MQKHNKNSRKNNSDSIGLIALLSAVAMCISYVYALSCFPALDLYFSSDIETPQVESSETNEIIEEVSKAPLPVDYDYYDNFQFKQEKYKNSEVKNGNLALIGSVTANGTDIGESSLIKSDVLNIYANMTPGIYGLSGAGLTIYGDALNAFDSWLVWFKDILPDNGLCIESAYCTAESIAVNGKPVDLNSGFSIKLFLLKNKYNLSDTDFAPLREQSHLYGLIQRYPADKEEYTGKNVDYSQYRYVGLPHSDYMQRYKLCLEEYVDKIRTEKVIEFKSRFEANTAYVVYYVPLDEKGNSTDVPLPSGEEVWQISGDGQNGFIVTVKIKL